ncbi:hypothetical protein HBA55_29720 [Pseudomaricurvus alkylphenolicus]|uniref:hypothetical protein n=1 Tax=Pseudomaricurvus alkylphenolicus TaxID=1306991 RepID=UPI00141EB1DC|nr:hypothetical protein [Pseudomaricurvus alkylphenolicus]NIB43818.1 hypothetical protein [Pseudomaricurvus alkylphenolicus]
MLKHRMLRGSNGVDPVQFGGGVVNAFTADANTTFTQTLSGDTLGGLQEGDIVVVWAVQTDSGSSTNPLSFNTSGYTVVNNGHANDTIDTFGLVGYKVMGATPDTDVVINKSGTLDDYAIGVQYFRGVNTVGSSSVSGGINGVDGSSANATPSKDGSAISFGILGGWNHLSVSTYTMSGFTVQSDAADSGNAAVAVGTSYYEWTYGEGTINGTWLYGGGDNTGNSRLYGYIILEP